MRPVRIAAQLHPQHGDYRALRDAAIRAEELGYDIVYNWDHFYPLDGDPDGPHLEPKVAALRRWCAEVGRDPDEIESGLGVEPDDVERFMAEDAPAYLEMGFSQFTLGFTGPAWNVDAGRSWLAWRDEINRGRAATAPVSAATR